MVKVTIPELVIRTTVDHPGYVHGISVGAGAGIDAALADLLAEGRRQAEEIVLALLDQHPEDQHPAQAVDAEWPFEVIGVRLVEGHRGDLGGAWVAIGTLCSAGRTPWSANYWKWGRRSGGIS